MKVIQDIISTALGVLIAAYVIKIMAAEEIATMKTDIQTGVAGGVKETVKGWF